MKVQRDPIARARGITNKAAWKLRKDASFVMIFSWDTIARVFFVPLEPVTTEIGLTIKLPTAVS